MTSSAAPSRKALSRIACSRLQKELAEWQRNPPAGFKHRVTDNLQRWVIELNGVRDDGRSPREDDRVLAAGRGREGR
ncbi:unnamed protein product [Linum tenue]|uniref:Uncharacterized protein n=1 Tax=Linum tenue TaxID=586396 RepID=A0AAV0MEQ4_9ROSI|nr:unnamed protein product [Linum tenue]